MSIQEEADLYMAGAEQLALLALDNKLTPPELEKIAGDPHPRLIPFLHVWAVRNPKDMPFRQGAFVRVVRESGMVSADAQYILHALARVHSQLAGRVLSALLPHAGDDSGALYRIANDNGLQITPRPQRGQDFWTDLDLDPRSDAVWVRHVMTGKEKITTPADVSRLASAANKDIPNALDMLRDLAKGGEWQGLALDMLVLMSRVPDGKHRHTARLMVQTLGPLK
jgi:hypothetical protein